MKKDLETKRLLLKIPSLKDIDEAKKIIKGLKIDKDSTNYIIKLKNTNTIIGIASINIKDGYEINYIISSEYFGNGYSTEVVKELLYNCFKELNALKVLAKYDIENLKTRKTLLRNGFHIEKEIIYNKRRYYLYAINKDEYRIMHEVN